MAMTACRDNSGSPGNPTNPNDPGNPIDPETLLTLLTLLILITLLTIQTPLLQAWEGLKQPVYARLVITLITLITLQTLITLITLISLKTLITLITIIGQNAALIVQPLSCNPATSDRTAPVITMHNYTQLDISIRNYTQLCVTTHGYTYTYTTTQVSCCLVVVASLPENSTETLLPEPRRNSASLNANKKQKGGKKGITNGFSGVAPGGSVVHGTGVGVRGVWLSQAEISPVECPVGVALLANVGRCAAFIAASIAPSAGDIPVVRPSRSITQRRDSITMRPYTDSITKL
jgi:hypothetical protein